jgi:hypothetical protein
MSEEAAVGDSEPPLRRLSDAEALSAARLRQERAFIPSTDMFALVLQVLGGWEQLKAAVNMYRFLDAGPEADWPGQKDLPGAMNNLVKKYGIRWPHDRFANAVDHANKLRQRLAHFLYFSAIVGDEPPDRTFYFTALGSDGESFKEMGVALGLEWRDEEWARQNRREVSITEQELRETLAELKWLIDCCRGLVRIHGLLSNEDTNLPDDKVIDASMWQVNWWLPEWGNRETTQLTVGHLRRLPDETN